MKLSSFIINTGDSAALTTRVGNIEASLNNSLSIDSYFTPDISTATQLRFDKIQGYVYGTVSAPITDNLTCSSTNAILGVIDLVISLKNPEPTYPTSFKKLAGTYDIATTNYIYVQYIDPSTQLYTINKIQ